DPWSGHMAFPGGRVDPGDADARAAAERETLEELGLSLEGAERLGQLDDLNAGIRLVAPLVLSAFVYRLDARAPLPPNHPGAGAGAPRSGASRRLSLRATAVAGRLRRRSRSTRRVGPDVSPARGAVRRGGHALPGPLALSYSTLIVPFRPSASSGDLGSRPSRLVTKAYRPGGSEQAVVYRPGGRVPVRR